jgi:hypothetical protein
MKRNWLLTAVVLVITLITACASDPPQNERPIPAARSASAAQNQKKPAAVETERSQASEAMNKAKSLKADVAVKKEFEEAQALFDEAEALSTKSEEEAAEKYREAEAQFNAAYNDAIAKRDEAQRQLNLALDAIKSVEDAAGDQGTIQ